MLRAFVILVAATFASHALAERRVALVMGADDYKSIRPLDNAVNDARTIEAALESAGLFRYEISSFARPGFESRHNRRYWQRLPVLGLGVGAFSCEPPGPGAPHGARRANVRDLAVYLSRTEEGEPPDAEPREVLEAPAARGEAVFLALRTSRGLGAAAFAAEFGAPPRAFWAAEIARLVSGGLLVEEPGGDLRLSARGRMLSDSVFACFV